MFCTECGKPITDSANFCTHCGASTNPIEAQPAYSTPISTKKASKKKIVIILTSCILTVAIIIAIISSFLPKRANFDIEYSPEGIEKFLNVVCENVDGDYARVANPDYDSPAGNSCYAAMIEVKLANNVSKTIQMRFYNRDDSDKVSFCRLAFSNSDSKNIFNCKQALLIGLEKTLCGKSIIEEYIPNFNKASEIGSSVDFSEEKVIAEYWLTDELKATITCDRSSGWSWDWDIVYVLTTY